MSHTPGKLVLSEDGRPELYNQCQIIESDKSDLIVYYQFKNKEDARRLVACWNACDGLHTESLESQKPLTDQIVDALNEAYTMKAKRDELLAALKAYDAWADKTICKDPELKAIRDQMRAAIAKAEGTTP
jgi:hypothetical protein